MQLFSCRNVMVAAMLLVGSSVPASAQAGLIPWAYNAVFGTTPMYGYGYAAPAYGYAAGYPGSLTMSSYYSPAWSTYSAGYTPAFGYDSFGGGFANYGYSSPCAPCGCNPCGCAGGCASGNCASGNCATGNCGAGYAPDIQNGPTPEPTRPQPNPPAANPPIDLNRNPPVDDFTRVPARTNDTTIPSTNPPVTPNVNTNPGTNTNPNPGSVPSTIPNRSLPNAVPDTNNTPSAPPFNSNNLNNGTDSLFERPMLDRTPAPVEPGNPGRPNATPNSTDVLPLGTEVLPAPLELESVPQVSLKVERQRIVTQAGYRMVSADRVPVAPRLSPVQELAHK